MRGVLEEFKEGAVDTMFEGLFQPMHLLVIGVIAFVLFGPKRLPELGRGLGDGIREFKRSINDMSVSASTTTSQGNSESKETPGASIGGANPAASPDTTCSVHNS